VLRSLAIPVALGVIFAWVLATGSAFEVYVAGAIAIYGLAAVGQGWLMGKAGQLSLGGGAIFACGAFSAALVTNLDAPWTTAVPVALLAATLGGALVGAVVAVPGLRFRGVYLLLATLALQYIVTFAGLQLQGRPEYLGGVPVNVGWGGDAVAGGQAIAVTAGLILLVVVLVLSWLYRSQAGREWSAIRENELRASVMGVNVRLRKTTAFIGSSAVTGLAGGLFAYYIGLVSYSTFTLALALQLVIMVFVGGAGSVLGPVIGAVIVTVLPYWLQDTVGAVTGSGWYSVNGPFIQTVIYGLVLVLILLYARDGAAGIRRVGGRLRGRVSRRRSRAPASAVTLARRDPGDPAAPGATTDAQPYFAVESLSVSYGGTGVAVHDASFDVPRGSILGILGRNGAGKSSILKAIGGFPASEGGRVAGDVSLDGQRLKGRSPGARAAAGIILVPEQHKVFADLTVAEHFALAGVSGTAVTEVLRATGLDMLEKRLDARAGTLSGGEAQFLALGSAVVRQPRVLLVDEMSLGLAPIAVSRVCETLIRIRDTTGCTILLVEQNARVAAAVADKICILENGEIVWTGLPADIPADKLETAYLGRTARVAHEAGA